MDGILDTQKDHVWLINQCIDLLAQNGSIFFSTNYSKFKLHKEALHTENIKDITRQTTPFDFEGKLDRWCYLIKNN
jgi:23S rRNA (cytosine1962-C5)-methyltransferase